MDKHQNYFLKNLKTSKFILRSKVLKYFLQFFLLVIYIDENKIPEVTFVLKKLYIIYRGEIL